jgi:hypothetical protein
MAVKSSKFIMAVLAVKLSKSGHGGEMQNMIFGQVIIKVGVLGSFLHGYQWNLHI